MDFACSHVVCNWRPDGEASSGDSLVVPDYHNAPTVKLEEAPPPLPPRQLGKPRPSSLAIPPPFRRGLNRPPAGPRDNPQAGPKAGPRDSPLAGPRDNPPAGPPAGRPASPLAGPRDNPPVGPKDGPLAGPPAGPKDGPLAGRPAGRPAGPQAGPPAGLKASPLAGPPAGPPAGAPPVPPRFDRLEGETRIRANMNVVLLSVGRLVDIGRDSGMETFQRPVFCGKCSAALSCLSSVQKNVWLCEFCGRENNVDGAVSRACVGRRPGVRSDDVYLPKTSEDDYQNLEDTMVVFCVDISGSMSITTEVPSGFASPTYVSRLEAIQDALKRALSSMLQRSPRRRVALVTFNDEVVIYGDGTRTPLTLRDWALIDDQHIWQQSSAFSVPHCIAETHQQLKQRITDLREHGATGLGPAALASVAVASRYPGSKVVLCTDGRANIGLGEMEQGRPQPSSPDSPDFYGQLAQRAVDSGVIISVMTFEGTDCRLADIGRLADATGGQVNIVTIGTVATEIQSVSADNVLATGATATLLAPDGVYFPYVDEDNHKVVKEVGNVTRGLEITFQFAVKPDFMDAFLKKETIPFQVQLSFKTRDQQSVTRIITEQRPVASSSRGLVARLNMAVLGVHCAQLCASLTMEGRVQEAQRQLRAQQHLRNLISRFRPIRKEESIYGNWMDTMTTICDDIRPETPVTQSLSDEAAKVVYQMRRASSFNNNNNHHFRNTPSEPQQRAMRKKKAEAEAE